MIKTKKLTTTAILLALASVLSIVKIYTAPLGGSVTLLSMLPIIILSLAYGIKWGLCSAFLYALIQIALDFGSLMGYGMTATIWVGCIVFDYLIAFTSIGLAGVFRKKGIVGICAGTFIAMFCRFASHVVSGTIFFDIWCPEGWSSPFIYSIVYNGTFMLPELVITAIAAVIIFKIPSFTKMVNKLDS